MRRIALAAWLSIVAMPIIGMPSAAAAALAAACGISRLAELPVTMDHRAPFVRGEVAGKDVMFLIDSATRFSRISPGSVANLGLSAESTNLRVSGYNRTTALSMAKIDKLTLGDLHLPRMQFMVVDSYADGGGVLAQDLLGLNDVEYDLPDGVIRLMRSAKCKNINLAYWTKTNDWSALDIVSADDPQKPTTFAVFADGQKLRGEFRTTSPTSSISRSAATRVGGVIGAGPPGDPSSATASFASIRIGDEEIRNTSMRVADLKDVDVVIGADFFLSHRIYIANGLHRVFFTYVGGAPFDTGTNPRPLPAPMAGVEPVDAEGYGRRAALYLTRRELGSALADYDKAVALAPREPRYLVARAKAHVENKDEAAAIIDLNLSLGLDPHDVAALVGRGMIDNAKRDSSAALADADLAAAVAAPAADERLAIAHIYTLAGAFDKALAEIDMWMRNHPLDVHRVDAFNGRCWTRALAGQQLDKAMADCNAALRLAPKSANALDSRGLAEWRAGLFQKAVADYNAALAITPGMKWSLYFRGLSERRLGMTAEGDKDMAAALAADPHFPEMLKQMGIGPEAPGPVGVTPAPGS